jgi:hypothetical protein
MTEGLGFAIVKAGGCRAVFLPSVHKGGISGGNPPALCHEHLYASRRDAYRCSWQSRAAAMGTM